MHHENRYFHKNSLSNQNFQLYYNFTIGILLIPKKCEYRSDKERYGPFPLGNRVGVDQVPLELNQRDFTLETRDFTLETRETVYRDSSLQMSSMSKCRKISDSP